MNIAADTRQDILGFITARGKMPTADVFSRFDLLSKRVIEEHLTALVVAGEVVRGLYEIAPTRGASKHLRDEDVVVAPRRAKAEPEAAPVVAPPPPPKPTPKPGRVLPKTDPTLKPRERVMELFKHAKTLSADAIYEAIPDVATKKLNALLWYQVQRGHFLQEGRNYTLTAASELSLLDRVDALFDAEMELIRREVQSRLPDVSPRAVNKMLTKLTQRRRLCQRGNAYRRPQRGAVEASPPGYVPLSTAEIDRVRKAGAATPEPPPKPGKETVLFLVVRDLRAKWHGQPPFVEDLVSDLVARAEVGKKKYGVRLQTHNGRNADMDAYQEASDLAMYMRQKLTERGDACEPCRVYYEHYQSALTLLAFLQQQLCQDSSKYCAQERESIHVEHCHES